MSTILITGASRGIGRALSVELAHPERHLLVSASRASNLDGVAEEIDQRNGQTTKVAGDLSSLDGARELANTVAQHDVDTVIHNAGLWPMRRELTGGVERAFMINHLAPLVLQRELNAIPSLKRVVYVSAGLIVAGRWDKKRTPKGEDFSSFRTYCTTKLCAAYAAQDLAEERQDLEVLAYHPGVVRTDLAISGGFFGALIGLIKRLTFEDPVACAKRQAQVTLDHRPDPGTCTWLDKDKVKPWPKPANDKGVRKEVREISEKLLDSHRVY